jgi:hypothetical protein
LITAVAVEKVTELVLVSAVEERYHLIYAQYLQS